MGQLARNSDGHSGRRRKFAFREILSSRPFAAVAPHALRKADPFAVFHQSRITNPLSLSCSLCRAVFSRGY